MTRDAPCPKKTRANRRSWASIKRAKGASDVRRNGYREAKEAFEFAERIREARQRLGLTQLELANKIGSTQPAMARLEAGGVTPNLDTPSRIASALGLELVVALRPRRNAP